MRLDVFQMRSPKKGEASKSLIILAGPPPSVFLRLSPLTLSLLLIGFCTFVETVLSDTYFPSSLFYSNSDTSHALLAVKFSHLRSFLKRRFCKQLAT